MNDCNCKKNLYLFTYTTQDWEHKLSAASLLKCDNSLTDFLSCISSPKSSQSGSCTCLNSLFALIFVVFTNVIFRIYVVFVFRVRHLPRWIFWATIFCPGRNCPLLGTAFWHRILHSDGSRVCTSVDQKLVKRIL